MPHRDEYDDDHGDDRHDDRYDDRRRDDEYDRDEGYDDGEDRPRRGARTRALEKVSLPAIFLIIVGCLGLGMSVLNITIELMGLNDDNPFAKLNKPNPNDPNAKAAENVGKVIGGVVQVVWSLIVFFGGVQMKGLKSRGFVFFASIWAMLPCNLCCLLGLPFGIWALVVINDPMVRRGFELTARRGS